MTVAGPHTDTTRLIQTSRQQLYPSHTTANQAAPVAPRTLFKKAEMASQQKNLKFKFQVLLKSTFSVINLSSLKGQFL